MKEPESRASTTEKMFSGPSSHRVNSTPNVTGTVLWKTIAPVTLPRARVSLPSLIQMTELSFSGSSVASGARTSATRPTGRPATCAPRSTASTNNSAPMQLHVQDEPRSPQFDRRPFPCQHPDERLAFLPDGPTLRTQELRARLY